MTAGRLALWWRTESIGFALGHLDCSKMAHDLALLTPSLVVPYDIPVSLNRNIDIISVGIVFASLFGHEEGKNT